MDKARHKYCYLLICIFLPLLTIGLYWPVRSHEFVKYDDNTYVTDNRQVRSGLSWASVRWAFTTGHASNWHPLTWLSHMLDCQLFGLKAGAHHFTNVLFHTANTLLLFIILQRMTSALWASAFVAAAFGLHPLHVESVAWVAERKDVLSCFFWMLTIWAYIRYTERPKISGYVLCLVFFVFGLMAKPMLVTLPFVLVLLDFWPLERISVGRRRLSGDSQSRNAENIIKQKPILHLLLEKLPFLVFSIASCIVTFFVQRTGGAVITAEAFGIKARTANAVVSYIGYILKMVWPSRLAVLYPHPGDSLSILRVAVCSLLLVMLSAVFIYLGRRRKYLTLGWLWYLGTLIPVIGLVQVGSQAMADRYTYIPLTGLFIIVGWGAGELLAGWHYRKAVLALLAAAVLSAAAVCTRLQLKYWQSSITLFERTLDVTDRNFLMHNNYANVLKQMGRADEAIEHFNKSLELRPNSAEVHNNLANALNVLGRIDEAIEHYKKALTLEPKFPQAHYNLASVLARQAKTDQAIAEYREALWIKPDYVEALSDLGFALARKGQFDEAVEYYKKAIGLEPDNIIAHGRLGLALANVDRIDEAIEQFRIVLQARPDDVEMYFNLGVLLERQGRIDEAIKAYRQALQIKPDYTKARQRLEAALTKKKNH